ncbi:MAG: hypothetical protein ACOCXP_02315 [Candidatus Dojkabacteria bacterium]
MSDNVLNSIEKLYKTDNTVFTVDDLAYIWEEKDDQQLWNKINYQAKIGKLKRLKRGVYSLAEREIDRLELSNKVKSPSYISFDTVLIKEGIMFQYYETIFAAANNSLEIQVQDTKLKYRKIKDEILLNKQGIMQEGNYTIATLERAYLDTLYLNKDRGLDNEARIDFDKCFTLAEIYSEKSLIDELKRRKKYVELDKA